MAMGGGILATGGVGSGQENTHGIEDFNDDNKHIFEKDDQLLYGKTTSQKIVSSRFLRKYIHVARVLKPVLTREACDIISTEYAKLRAQETVGSGRAKTQPVTARTLETLIRLSTAHAKARMSKRVELVRKVFYFSLDIYLLLYLGRC